MNSRIYWAGDKARVVLGLLLPSRATLRLATYFGVVSMLGLLFLARALYAATREDAFGIGHQLLGLSDLTGGAQTVLLNGERFHHAVSTSPQPLQTVLDRIEQHCHQSKGPTALLIDGIASRNHRAFAAHAPPGALRNAVFREQAATRGMVLCFVGGPNPDSVASWLTALRSFSSSRDLSAFGRLRYSFAELTAEGKIRVITLWADTGLNLSTLFPQTGDAPGSDSALLPRPPAARRTLSARAEGQPFSVRTYESKQSPEAAQHFYDSWLREHGYRAEHDAQSGASSYLRSDGYQAFLSILASEGHTFLTLTESGQADATATLEVGAEP